MAIEVGINVKADVKEMARDLSRIRAAIPRITSRAINELAVWARKEVVDDLSVRLNLPRTVVSKTKRRGKTTDRLRITKGTPIIPVATVRALSAGIQVTDVAGAHIRRKPGQGGGVKAKGGRFYKGAFKAPAPGGIVRVWKRRGPDRLPIFLPRIGTHKAMLSAYARKVDSQPGVAEFRKRFQRLADYELEKAGIR